jgi:hypothetical protein
VALGILSKTNMPILKSSSVQELSQLLDLYPAANLREQWPSEQTETKETICLSVAGSRKLTEIERFADEYLSCCKQHVYVFSHKGTLSRLPTIKLPEAEKVRETSERGRVQMLYLIKYEYIIVLFDPLRAVRFGFLWPVRLDFTSKYLIVRFVILEKNIGALTTQETYVGRKGMEEKVILQKLQDSTRDELNLVPVDLQKGVKELWGTGFMDCFRVRFKKKISTASEWMDEEKGIKEYNYDLYQEIQEAHLFSTLFEVSERAGSSVSVFSVDPPKGYIVFPRYSVVKGDTDHVVNEIIRLN